MPSPPRTAPPLPWPCPRRPATTPAGPTANSGPPSPPGPAPRATRLSLPRDAALAAYLTRLAGQGQALASVRQARGAVVKAHQLAGFPTPAGPVTAAALRGIGRSNGAAQGQAAPLTAEGLAAIRATAHLPRRGRGGCPERAAFARRRGLVDVALASVIRTACCASPRRWPWPGPM